MKIVETLLRLTQFAFVAIMLGLCGALLEQQLHGGTPTRLNYSMWALALAALSLLYLIPSVFVSAIRHPVAIMTLDFANSVFLLCAGIAMAAALGGKSCRDHSYLAHNGITSGGGLLAPRARRCHEANALAVFEWLTAFAFLASALLALVGLFAFSTHLRSASHWGRRG